MWWAWSEAVEGPNTTTIPLACQCLNWDTGFFPSFGRKVKHWLFLGLEPTSLQTETTPSVLLVLRPLDLARNKTGLQLADWPCRS